MTDPHITEFIKFVELLVERITELKGLFDLRTFQSFGKYVRKIEVIDSNSEYYSQETSLLKSPSERFPSFIDSSNINLDDPLTQGQKTVLSKSQSDKKHAVEKIESALEDMSFK